MAEHKITELMGDGISPELSKSVHTVIEALPVKLEIEQIDLTLENRRKDKKIYDVALASMIAHRCRTEISHCYRN